MVDASLQWHLWFFLCWLVNSMLMNCTQLPNQFRSCFGWEDGLVVGSRSSQWPMAPNEGGWIVAESFGFCFNRMIQSNFAILLFFELSKQRPIFCCSLVFHFINFPTKIVPAQFMPDCRIIFWTSLMVNYLRLCDSSASSGVSRAYRGVVFCTLFRAFSCKTIQVRP